MSKLSDLVREMNAKSRKLENSLINNRTVIAKDDLMKQYPQGIHINAFEFNTYDDADNFILTYVEDDGRYFYSTQVLTNMINNLLESYEGDIAALSRDFAEEPVLTKITKRLSKNRRNYFNYQFVVLQKGNSFVPVKEFGIAEIEDATVEDDGDILPPF